MRGKRIDSNQPEAVDFLRRAGYSVFITSSIGQGFPDLVVSRAGFTALVELKNEHGRGKRLTLPEQGFKNVWPGAYVLATSGENAWAQLEVERLKCKCRRET